MRRLERVAQVGEGEVGLAARAGPECSRCGGERASEGGREGRAETRRDELMIVHVQELAPLSTAREMAKRDESSKILFCCRRRHYCYSRRTLLAVALEAGERAHDSRLGGAGARPDPAVQALLTGVRTLLVDSIL